MSAPHLPYSHPPYPYPHRRPARAPVNPWLPRLILLSLTGIVLVFFALVLVVTGYQFIHHNEIYPGVSTVLGANLSGMTRQEAVHALTNRFTYANSATFTFTYGDQRWEYTAGELGVALDVEATVDAAFRAGREGNALDNLLAQLDMRLNGHPVVPVITYDQSVAERILSDIATAFINRPVLDAALTVRDGRAVASPAQVGRTVDVNATLAALRQEIVRLATHSEIALVVQEAQPTVWDASAAAERVNLALSAPVEFYIAPEDGTDKGPWVAQVPSLEKMLTIELVQNADGTASYKVGISLDEPRAFLNELAPQLAVKPENARFVFDDATRQLQVIRNSVNGRALDVEQTLAQFEQAVFAADPAARRVRLVFQAIPAAIPDTATAAELGITERIVQKTTYFYGSTPARRHNIEVAAANFHGLVIPPGGIFSFNEWLGDVSVESGYEQGLIIVGNQTITGVGGGVCQVATTAFQTAFYGGFPILERVEHAYRVGYYEEGEGPGMDATVYSPIVDFRFLNDTPYHLLIETYVNTANSTITWKFYSTSMNRRVVKEGPVVRNQTAPPPPIYRANPQLASGQIRQVDYAVSGADVYVWRTVYEGDRVIIDREEFHSHYVPWAAQFEVAPGDPRING